MRPRMSDQLPHGFELLMAGEDKEALATLAAPLIFLLDVMNELSDEVENAIPGPDLIPEIPRRIALLRRRDGRIARSAEASLVEGEKDGFRPIKACSDEYQFRIDGEVSEASAE